MSADSDLRALLVADGATFALVGQRVTADRAEQSAARPFVVFSRTASEPLTDLAGVVLKTHVIFDVQCWADTRAAANAVADAVTAAVRGATSQTVTGRSSAFDPELDLEATQLVVEWWE